MKGISYLLITLMLISFNLTSDNDVADKTDYLENIKSELKENKQFWDSIVNDDSISLDDKNHKYYPIYQETKESLESELKQIQSCSIKEQIRTHSKTKRKTVSLRFWTKAVLHGFHSMWYTPYRAENDVVRYKKKLPQSFCCFLNAQSVSVWFAGDGTKTISSVGAKFEVTAFSVEERLALKKAFLTKFGIHTVIIRSGVSKKGNAQWALKIPPKSYAKFRSLITQTQLIPNYFPHKLYPKK